jgi:5-methylcytosine-specific restriction protein B
MPAELPPIIDRIESGDFEIPSNPGDELARLIAAAPELYARRTADDEVHAKFLNQFPAESLADMTVDDYCLGYKSEAQNFCWWLERGLKPALGSYMPGTARGHLLYRQKDNKYYRHKALQDLSPEQAVAYVAKTAQFIATRTSLADAAILDDDREVYEALEIEPRVVAGPARKLRIFQAYHPDDAIPINSHNHIAHFLKHFGLEDEEPPRRSRRAPARTTRDLRKRAR